MERIEAQLAVETIVANSTDAMFEKFDMLHKRGINDDDVARALRDLGHNRLAENYLVWQNDGEPLSEDEDGPTDYGGHLVTDPGDSPSYAPLEEQLQGLAYIREAHARHFSEIPSPPTRAEQEAQLLGLQRQFERRLHTDAVFAAKVQHLRNAMYQLDNLHQIDDYRHSAYLLAALIERDFPTREAQRQAWEQGMAAAKLAAQGIKPAKNPYEEEA
ncbi:hypothetical protein PP641_gp051 [Arthrobacter phage SilentRX]|uniref:Uncharacterized protein n=1 Tax=Arthrobacter phage SilentRX TaxID=2836091 RepID=A0A8F3IL58_9CAUD|nr:hypothetical protein PP641_gp051 [Arthrobacter phage SilentRX]QWY82791.1 hypothetical protein SEA_SILENTRX_51 [Arthrobacter phage SilentRX]